jgi:hypothetical protein
MTVRNFSREFVCSLLILFTGVAAVAETVQVPMRDGTLLTTDYHLPKEGGPSWPVILMRSTYGRGQRNEALAERGYVLVWQDVRGMGKSEGDAHVFYAEGWRPEMSDGADTVAWIKAQPWCNGNIGSWGGSALGITQLLMAPSTSDLQAQVIHVGSTNFYTQATFQGGVWRKNMLEGWLTAIKQPHIIDLYKTHPTYDDYWKHLNADAQAEEVTAPGIHIGGWYDIFQLGTIDGFKQRQERGGEGAKGNQTLIIRPNAHGPLPKESPLKLNDNHDDIPTSQIEKEFIDHWLQGADNGFPSRPAVYYYTFGDDSDPDAPGNEWRTAEAWPPFETESTAFHLAEDGALSTDKPKRKKQSVSFTYDPANPVRTHGGNNLLMPSGPFDQRDTNKDRDDVLTFVTAPLEAPVEATGRVRVRLYISTDAPDTDFTAKLVDVYPDGDERELLIVENIKRVKLRRGLRAPEPLLTSSDEVVVVTLDLLYCSWVFNTGHRIGLQISSSNHPRWEVNPNTGEDFPSEGNLRKARNTVHFSRKHPSALYLPLRDLSTDEDGNGLTVREEWVQGNEPLEIKF